ncbi:MAG: hypothetical protein ACR2GH_10740 [Pseudonocardia sp.]
MTGRTYGGLFVAEGTSDLPLADIVETLFLDRGVSLHLSRPDFSLLPKVSKDVGSRLLAGRELLHGRVDVVVVHRDADGAGQRARFDEISDAVAATEISSHLVPIIPVRMTEAWLLLDEQAIRTVAGNPRGRTTLSLPRHHEVEGVYDPKAVLRQAVLEAASVTGRRRDRLDRRFSENRRQLLERLDPHGPVSRLPSWCSLIAAVDAVLGTWTSDRR